MSASAAILTRTWPVGCRTVTLTVPRPRKERPVCVSCEWSPSVPKALTAAEWIEYRAGRDAALAALAEELGGNVGLVEL